MINFVDAIKSLDNSYNVYIDGDINSQEDWDNKVKFITESLEFLFQKLENISIFF